MLNEFPTRIRTMIVGPKEPAEDCFITAYNMGRDGAENEYFLKDWRIPCGSDLHRMLVKDKRFNVDRVKPVKQNGHVYIELHVHTTTPGEPKDISGSNHPDVNVYLLDKDEVWIDDERDDYPDDEMEEEEFQVYHYRVIYDENSRYIGMVEKG
ncbi:MAG: hypothetical protein MJZ73_02345 [Bacteroidaceae bacterium]|nr:hypothetical protein [Bacteroidaceae bacterium]